MDIRQVTPGGAHRSEKEERMSTDDIENETSEDAANGTDAEKKIAPTKSIKKNYFYSLTARIIALLVPLIVTPYVSRILNPDGVGVCSYIASLVSYFVLFANLGIETYAGREIAMHRGDGDYVKKFSVEITVMKSILTAVCLAVYYVLFIAVLDIEEKLLYIIYSVTLVSVAFNFNWLFQGIEKFNILALASILAKVAYAALLFVFVKTKDDLPIYAAIVTGTTLLEYAITIPFIFFNVHGKIRGGVNPFRHLKNCLIYFLPTVAVEIYTVVDKTMIGLITGSDSENGYYEYADKLIKMPMTAITAINVIIESRMSYYFAKGMREEADGLAEKAVNFIFILALPFAFGLFAISGTAIPLYLGESYEKCVVLVRIMAWMIPIISASNLFGSFYYTPVGKRKVSALFLFIGAAVNVAFNSFMIMLWQSVGAAIASVIAESVITALYIIFARKFFPLKKLLKNIYKYLIAAGIMGCIVMIMNVALPANIGFLILEIFAGVAIYALFLLIMRTEFFIGYVKRTFTAFKAKVRRGKTKQ